MSRKRSRPNNRRAGRLWRKPGEMCRFAFLALMLIPLAALTQADGQRDGSMSTEDIKSPDPGLRALEVLESLKKSMDARGAACRQAFGHESFCRCLNDRLPLDLSLIDYVVLITSTKDDPAYLALPLGRQRLVNDAVHVRDLCVHTMLNQ
ncbi:MAG: hypothetical protein ACT4NU_09855 [Chromatiales bacterium]